MHVNTQQCVPYAKICLPVPHFFYFRTDGAQCESAVRLATAEAKSNHHPIALLSSMAISCTRTTPLLLVVSVVIKTAWMLVLSTHAHTRKSHTFCKLSSQVHRSANQAFFRSVLNLI